MLFGFIVINVMKMFGQGFIVFLWIIVVVPANVHTAEMFTTVNALLNRSVVLECPFQNAPQPAEITWTGPNGQMIADGGDLVQNVQSSKYTLQLDGRLVINDVRVSDDGVYTCLDANDTQVVIAVVNVSVIALPSPPRHCFVRRLGNSSRLLSCSPGTDGGSPQTFFLRLCSTSGPSTPPGTSTSSPFWGSSTSEPGALSRFKLRNAATWKKVVVSESPRFILDGVVPLEVEWFNATVCAVSGSYPNTPMCGETLLIHNEPLHNGQTSTSPPGKSKTLYVVLGTLFGVGCFIAVGVVAVIFILKKRRRREKETNQAVGIQFKTGTANQPDTNHGQPAGRHTTITAQQFTGGVNFDVERGITTIKKEDNQTTVQQKPPRHRGTCFSSCRSSTVAPREMSTMTAEETERYRRSWRFLRKSRSFASVKRNSNRNNIHYQASTRVYIKTRKDRKPGAETKNGSSESYRNEREKEQMNIRKAIISEVESRNERLEATRHDREQLKDSCTGANSATLEGKRTEHLEIHERPRQATSIPVAVSATDLRQHESRGQKLLKVNLSSHSSNSEVPFPPDPETEAGYLDMTQGRGSQDALTLNDPDISGISDTHIRRENSGISAAADSLGSSSNSRGSSGIYDVPRISHDWEHEMSLLSLSAIGSGVLVGPDSATTDEAGYVYMARPFGSHGDLRTSLETQTMDRPNRSLRQGRRHGSLGHGRRHGNLGQDHRFVGSSVPDYLHKISFGDLRDQYSDYSKVPSNKNAYVNLLFSKRKKGMKTKESDQKTQETTDYVKTRKAEHGDVTEAKTRAEKDRHAEFLRQRNDHDRVKDDYNGPQHNIAKRCNPSEQRAYEPLTFLPRATSALTSRRDLPRASECPSEKQPHRKTYLPTDQNYPGHGSRERHERMTTSTMKLTPAPVVKRQPDDVSTREAEKPRRDSKETSV